MNDNPELTRSFLGTTLELLETSARSRTPADPAGIAHRFAPRKLPPPPNGFTPPAAVGRACEVARQALKSLTGNPGRWTEAEREAVLDAVNNVNDALGDGSDWPRVLAGLVEQLDEQFVVAEAPTRSARPEATVQSKRPITVTVPRSAPRQADPRKQATTTAGVASRVGAAGPASGRSHRIDKQNPQSAWDIFIDETGSSFKHDGAAGDRVLGRVVAVALPDGLSGLEPLPLNWHSCRATGASGSDILAGHLSRLLDAEVGILGLSAELVPEAARDGWASLIQRVILLAAATVPLSRPEGSTLRFWVERRGDTTEGKQTLGL